MARPDAETLTLRVAGDRVHGNLEDFPVRLDLTVPAALRGGLAQGARLRDGTGELAQQLTVDADSGRVQGWVRARALRAGQDAEWFLDIGRSASDADPFAGWAVNTDGVPVAAMEEGADLLVEGWVHVEAPRAEAAQVIAARWSFAERMEAYETYDAGATDGLATQGFFGAVFDGRHVYFSPQCNNDGRHGQALRYDTRRPFGDAAAWEGYDAGNTGGLQTRGYYGALFDGRYVYYVPRTDGQAMHRRVLRFDTCADFRDPSSWQARDGGEPVSSQGGAFDGRYVYFAPGYHQDTGPTGRVLRYDTTGAFENDGSWALHDAGGTDGLTCTNYDGALYDGRHVYFAPLDGSAVLRHDPGRPFDDAAAWSAFDVARLPGEPFGMCVGAVFDGRWVYFTPYAHSTVVRYDTEAPFGEAASWQSFEAAGIDGLRTKGYDGAAFDGRFVYFIPFWEGDDPGQGFHARTLRYDTTRPFDEAASWLATDGAALAPPNPGGFNGGAFDGRFLYMAPWRKDNPAGQIVAHGHVLRLDTAGPDAGFQLRLVDCGHNGGLGGSVPGPSWLVNCDQGPVTVQAHRMPAAGWHHVAGVYRAEAGAELWVDGQLAGTAPARGALVRSGLPVSWGQLPGGTARLDGRCGHGRARSGPVPEGWVRTSWESLRDPQGFVRVDP